MSMEDPTSAWTPIAALDDFAPGEAKVLKKNGHFVACFQTEAGELLAIANHCPHEGYPMHQGSVKECVITCAWHNFKFDLRDGTCLKGDEDIRTYAVRVKGGQVEVLLEEIDLSVAVPGLYESLQRALLDRKIGQAARDTTRLLAAGQSAADLTAALLRFDATYSEFGTTHGTALALDALGMAGERSGSDRVLPLVQAMDQLAEDHRRRPPRPRPEPSLPEGDAAQVRANLRSLVEAEEVEEAEALLRGSIARFGARAVADWLLDSISDHCLGFLHSAIYHAKLVPFLAARNWEDADLILGAHLYRVLQSTRQDTLPTWRPLREALDRGRDAPLRAEEPASWDDGDLRAALLDAPPRESLGALQHALASGVPVTGVLDAVILAASERMLRFDVAIHDDTGSQDDWLDITHALTGAVAARELDLQERRPEVLQIAVQAAHFVARSRALDRPAEARHFRPGAGATASLDDVAQAIARGDGDGAARAVLSCPPTAENRSGLRALLLSVPLGDQITRPIVVTHLIKTPLAATWAAAGMGDHPDAWLPLAACVRLVAEPGGERRVGRMVHEAVRFVEHGEIPKILSD
jgi:nitrite reductase/ring-hydroxylating ferredoxin subunit